MAEETLVKEVLTEQMISAGAELISRIDQSDLSVVAAVWFYDSESNQWRLLLASQAVVTEGPLAVYRRVKAALAFLAIPLSLDSISVVAPDDSRIKTLASVYRTGRAIEGRRVFRSAINGHFIDDAYVYRLLPIEPAA